MTEIQSKKTSRVVSETMLPMTLWPVLSTVQSLLVKVISQIDPRLEVRVAKEDYDNRIVIGIIKHED